MVQVPFLATRGAPREVAGGMGLQQGKQRTCATHISNILCRIHATFQVVLFPSALTSRVSGLEQHTLGPIPICHHDIKNHTLENTHDEAAYTLLYLYKGRQCITDDLKNTKDFNETHRP